MKRLQALVCRTGLILALGIMTVDAVVIGIMYPVVALIAAIGLAVRRMRRGWQPSDAYGTARFAGWGDLMRGRLLSDSGVILGRLGLTAPPPRLQAVRSLLSPSKPPEQACRQFVAAFGGSRQARDGFIRTNDFVHLATFSPAGGGKSVSTLVPNLLSYAGNCVVVDPKGELYKLTAKHRRKKFGHRIVRLDAAGLCGPGSDKLNPYDWIDPQAKDFIDRCRDLANMLVVRTGKEQDPHWNDSAENIIAAFTAYVCACEGNPAFRNLRGMRALLASRDNYTSALENMRTITGFGGVLEQLGQSLTWHVDKELGSVMSSAQRHTNIFDSPLVADCTGGSSFDPAELRTGRMTVYLVTPADKLAVWAGLQRLWLGTLIRIITRGVPTEKNPVLFMVDEAAHIGHMQALEDAVTLMRGMGIRLWLFFQSIDQLNKCFGERASTVLDNIATQQYFGINSYETAEAISKRIGEQTIAVTTAGDNSGTSFTSSGGAGGKSPPQHGSNSGTSSTVSETSRRLLKEEEILTLGDNVALVFHKNYPVILAERIKYYSDKAFRKRPILRSWGTGRTQGLGLAGVVLPLAALLLSGLLTAFVASLPAPGHGPHPLSFLHDVLAGPDPYPVGPWLPIEPRP
jgi:type IV secretion system protein VirD4